jgi:CDP-paratose 2-epimerase
VYSIPALHVAPLRVQSSDYGEGFVVDASQLLPVGLSESGISEQFSTAPPVSLYGATKSAGELMALEYAYRFGTPLYVNRCGVMAGAGQFGHAAQGIFSWWIHSWAAKRSLSYIGFGGLGHQVRDCLHPDDLADLITVQMNAATPSPIVCNVSGGSGSAMSLAQLSGWCSERFGPRKIGAVTLERPYDLPWVVLDNAFAFKQFGWQPKRSVLSILSEIADHAVADPFWLDRCGG